MLGWGLIFGFVAWSRWISGLPDTANLLAKGPSRDLTIVDARGRLVAEGASAADSRPWLFYFPGLAILIIVLCINLIGDGIRDAFDPSANRVRA